jgi:hypothetical protein
MVKRTATAPAGLDDAKKRATRTGRVTAPKPVEEPLGDPTSAAAWKKGKAEGLLVRVPSGNTARIRTPGMDVFLHNGTIPNALIPLVQKSIRTGKEPTEKELEAILGDDAGLDKIIDLAENVLVEVCIDPVVAPTPYDDEGNRLKFDDSRRDENLLYADEVDFADKMFIFSVATGGTQNLERFREQSGLNVGVISER